MYFGVYDLPAQCWQQIVAQEEHTFQNKVYSSIHLPTNLSVSANQIRGHQQCWGNNFSVLVPQETCVDSYPMVRILTSLMNECVTHVRYYITEIFCLTKWTQTRMFNSSSLIMHRLREWNHKNCKWAQMNMPSTPLDNWKPPHRITIKLKKTSLFKGAPWKAATLFDPLPSLAQKACSYLSFLSHYIM